MQKAIGNVKSLLGEKPAILAQRWFEWAGTISRSNRVFQRIASAKDKEQIADSLAEIRYALIFAGLGFDVEFEPTGDQGPDLMVRRDNIEIVVEVKRFRKTNPDLPTLNLDDEELTLPEYGNIPRDVRKTFDKILTKFRQVENQRGVIAIWNDDEELEEIEVGLAVKDIRSDFKNGLLTIPDDLLFVLYGSKWELDNKQLYCFPFHDIEQPFETWKIELEELTALEHIERAFTICNTIGEIK
jgi:hypothetical protein